VLAQSHAWIAEERAMRQGWFRKYIKALEDIKRRKEPLKRDQLHQSLWSEKNRRAGMAAISNSVLHRG
jgi:hypothetical protein